MQSSKLIPLINVKSCVDSIAFYAKLGFEIVTTWENDGATRFAQLRNGDIEMILNQPHDPQAPRDAEPYSGMMLLFRVSSVHTLYNELRAKGLAGEKTALQFPALKLAPGRYRFTVQVMAPVNRGEPTMLASGPLLVR